MADVTPGYSFFSNDGPITAAKLNLIGMPTVALGDAEVTAAKLASAISITNLTVTSTLFGTGVQALSGAGAVDVTNLTTEVTTTGANALTLANGTNGQIKVVRMVYYGGDGTLTPTAGAG